MQESSKFIRLLFKSELPFWNLNIPGFQPLRKCAVRKKIQNCFAAARPLSSLMALQDMWGEFLGQCFAKLTLVGSGLIVAVSVHHSYSGPYVPLWLLSFTVSFVCCWVPALKWMTFVLLFIELGRRTSWSSKHFPQCHPCLFCPIPLSSEAQNRACLTRGVFERRLFPPPPGVSVINDHLCKKRKKEREKVPLPKHMNSWKEMLCR